MSSPIMPIQGPVGPASPTSTRRVAGGDMNAFVAELTSSDRDLRIEAALNGPPPDVLDQIATAGRIHDQLRESGHEVRFSSDEDGRPAIELHDRGGNTVRTMSIAEVLDVTAGKPLR
jgi:hypothetical protein